MDFRDTAAEAAFRAKLRDWYGRNFDPAANPSAGRPDVDYMRSWSRKLHDAGYVGLTWPKEYGGAGLSPGYQAIYFEEMARAHAPEHIGIIGLNMAGPTIMAWGTPEQKQRHLPKLLSGEEIWCQGFSEPGSGSDLAGARTTAVLDGDHWVVNGQKVWSSWAHIADWCILVVRTDPAAKKHEGLSYLLVDMHAPGVEVRPLRQITGDPEFNEIFFTDVRVPKESILGRPGDGWKVAMTTLLHERGTLAFALVGQLRQHFTRLVELARQPASDGSVPAGDPVVRDAIAREWIELQSLAFTNYRTLTTLLTKGQPGPESSVVKLVWSEANQRLTKLARGLQGLSGMLDDDGGVWDGYWQYRQLRSRGNTIEAGTSEILRNIVAERVLGLPRSR
ncbi:acyl-CoA dehydrogenase family protein [Kibdelosporangium phytohabitans]|uniref:Acyl-CoA dehydrogenase n=1 Tax=Kibdelosporangium phytohabitans TaxID=860235 RepID=A0A0N9HYG9_9PSEU|nr:acyl-CoA dehydrogenase family protein [Kibdelosporangium phytohabitans]ALG07322.1 acyl-CoA dehydrogenase [Kibdelosporangium phytohabitans]MBE1471811.1 alkylation response protein AidB-like acyl-CoA dehydrogenase [Kibdelosporangium phytohabitans]